MEENKFWGLIEHTWVKSGRNEERLEAIAENNEGILPVSYTHLTLPTKA